MKARDVLLNGRIVARTVMLIDENGINQGKVNIDKAMSLALLKHMDLWQVSKDAVPVCKIVDYGKMMYNRSKRNKQNKNVHRHRDAKEITFNFHIADHDLEIKNKKAYKILSKGIKVIYTMELVGRECKMVKEGLEKFEESISYFDGIADWEERKVSPVKTKKRRTIRAISTVLNPKVK